MITLIIGRSAAGKDTLAQLVNENSPLCAVKSYTTRPPRTENEDSHHFVDEDFYQTIKDEVVAHTTINGYRYFATRYCVANAGLYVIDPEGAYELMENMNDTAFQVIYVSADPDERRCHAILRADNPEEAAETFDARQADEDARFAEFEKKIEEAVDGDTSDVFPRNLVSISVVENDFQSRTLETAAETIINNHLAHTSLYDMIVNIGAYDRSSLISVDTVLTDPNTYQTLVYSEQESFDPVPIDIFTEIVRQDIHWMHHVLQTAVNDREWNFDLEGETHDDTDLSE